MDDPTFPAYLTHVIFLRNDGWSLVGHPNKDSWLKSVRMKLDIEFVQKREIAEEPDFYADLFSLLAWHFGRKGEEVHVISSMKARKRLRPSSPSEIDEELQRPN